MPRSKVRGFRLQSRDLTVLAELSRLDFATRKHLAVSCFNGSYEAGKKRLLSLIQSGLLSEKKSTAFVPGVLRLTRKGIDLLRMEQKFADNSPSFERRALSTYREHELGIRDVRSVFVSALRKGSTLTLVEFQMSRSLMAFSVDCAEHHKIETVRPDAFMMVRERGKGVVAEHCFFFEIDRSTETQAHLSHLASLYLAHFRQGGFARKRGRTPLSRTECPVRALIILDSPVRLANTARKLLAETYTLQ